MNAMLEVSSLSKTFVLHNQGEVTSQVIQNCSFRVKAGEAVMLVGPSGSGKSTLLRCLFGNYLPDEGSIDVLHFGKSVDLVHSAPATINQVRRHTLGWVSQFLRVIPRVSTLELVAEPAMRMGFSQLESFDRATTLLTRLNVPEKLWKLAPATFSGGEQQRVNVARGLVADHPLLLVDEPTASLDDANRAVVVELLNEAVGRGAALVGIFHDSAVRDAIGTRLFRMGDMASPQAPVSLPAPAFPQLAESATR
jgi:alpha-D-ribose 1-methylphosphonate 5-triphosphate synthase subunit PhnL